jgi:hypothetical protein
VEELDYLSRFSQDLENMLLGHKGEKQSRQSVYTSVYSEIKSKCEVEILRVRDDNVELAGYLERFSNFLLTSISNLERSDAINEIKSSAKIELLEQILETVKRERDLISNREEVTSQPEYREKREGPEKTRDIGERPESIKNIRNSQDDEKTEL